MKRKMMVRGLAFVCMFLMAAGVALAAGKIAYVDLSSTFDKYEKTKVFDEALGSIQQEKEKSLTQLADEIKAIEDKMPLLSEKEKVSKQKDLDEKTQKLKQISQQVALDLRKERDERLKEILQDIEKVIQSYAQKNQYDFIMNDRVLLYGSASADVTQDIIDLLNTQYKQESKKQTSKKK
ncbi:MAG: OmpH family outer membrane protein [Candidatus Omnitrophica bacterium]|nr:OmpH family outer membrane protein [Candidatus Omnitrophota bacterium]MDD5574794.1 OmpH family outer membrane protein [Candidatus Omnitrophota bacterium]